LVIRYTSDTTLTLHAFDNENFVMEHTIVGVAQLFHM